MTPASSRQQQSYARNATRMLNGTVKSKFTILSTKGPVTETNGSVDFRANIQDVPVSYRADRFDDLPDFPTLVDDRRSNRKGVLASNVF